MGVGRFFLPVALGASHVCVSGLAVANSGVAAISANDYSYVVGDHSFDTTCNAEATGFYNTLTSGPNFSSAVRLYDITATDRSMCDPNAPGGSANDYDTSAFDQSNLAVSFVCLHGTCNHITSTMCMTGSWCPSGAACPNMPPNPYMSRCTQNWDRWLATSSPFQSHGNWLSYSQSYVRWGESPQAGSWGGAGTNGGTNLIVMVNSCGLTAPFWTRVTPALAGAHLMAGIFPHGADASGRFSDTANWSSRGTTLANYANANPNQQVADSWFATLNSTPQAGYGDCPQQGNAYTYGGGRGINGCGGHYVIAVAPTWLAAAGKTAETWLQVKDDSRDTTGNAYTWFRYQCNYDCATYPFTK